MNSHENHPRAEQLIAQESVEGISANDQSWLEEHLRECERCAAVATSTSRAIQSLKSVAIPLPKGLVQKTQFRVRLRAQQPLAEPQRQLLWVACAVSWAFGAVTAPYVWRGLQWIGERTALPRAVPDVGFGLWWALPAIVAGAIVLAENARFERQRDWLRGQWWDVD